MREPIILWQQQDHLDLADDFMTHLGSNAGTGCRSSSIIINSFRKGKKNNNIIKINTSSPVIMVMRKAWEEIDSIKIVKKFKE